VFATASGGSVAIAALGKAVSDEALFLHKQDALAGPLEKRQKAYGMRQQGKVKIGIDSE